MGKTIAELRAEERAEVLKNLGISEEKYQKIVNKKNCKKEKIQLK